MDNCSVFAVARFITTPFTVWDTATERKLYSAGCFDNDALPEEISDLLVIQVYAADDMIYIDVNSKQ